MLEDIKEVQDAISMVIKVRFKLFSEKIYPKNMEIKFETDQRSSTAWNA